jgi:dihydrofolate reductase
MGKLVVTEFVTVDGVAQAPGGPDEDRDSGFVHGGWQAPLLGESAGNAMFEQASGMDALLLGRKTYDLFADYWPNAPEEIPFTSLLNGAVKYVASRTLSEPLAWSGSSVITGDLAAAVGAMKERHREVHVIGSLDLLQTLLRLDLVDRLTLWVHPVVLGTGKRVFADGAVPRALNLSESRTYDGGTVQLTYDNAGDPTYGNMADEDDLRRATGT